MASNIQCARCPSSDRVSWDTLHTSQECRSVTLCTPSGTILRTVSITPATKVAEICLYGEQLFLENVYDTPLEPASLLWKHATSGGQLANGQIQLWR